MSVVVLVRAWPALPATVTSGTPAAICMVMLVWRSECTVLWGSPAASHTLCTHVYTVPVVFNIQKQTVSINSHFNSPLYIRFLSTNTVSTESAANRRRVSAEYAKCDSVFLYSRISDISVFYTVVEHIGIAFQIVALLCTQPAKHQLINHRGAYFLD